ncbi:uncharacterized protein CLUP02_13574 [Colletotrichum lupini]|uniref:Uncharacterized protein n=1 Tax=Colletotrichum lupini TaxID=145971 RepID=A0A9Q8T4D0_9PEZI|nr:uncharacterized protein CLUP02_13574 [Colletotrichum lupini]UQC88052.1 hypothetical protein CLUP02_13574 [Colletotrichum lupini]
MISLAPGDSTRSFPEVKLGKRSLSVKAANQRPDPHQASKLHVPSTYDLHGGEKSRRPEPAVHMLQDCGNMYQASHSYQSITALWAAYSETLPRWSPEPGIYLSRLMREQLALQDHRGR